MVLFCFVWSGFVSFCVVLFCVLFRVVLVWFGAVPRPSLSLSSPPFSSGGVRRAAYGNRRGGRENILCDRIKHERHTGTQCGELKLYFYQSAGG